jgi:adenylosuccinate lyase
MAKIWSEQHKFETYLRVEIAVCEAWHRAGVIPKDALDAIRKNARIDVERINEIEKVTNHDVIAFVEQVSETIGKASSYFHYGMTSSDLIDTALNLILLDAGRTILAGMEKLTGALRKCAVRYRDIPAIGRTHGVHAEPITFGFKVAGWYFEMKRNQRRIKNALEEIRVGKISGAVGTYAHLDPKIEKDVCKKLGLVPDECSTQIVSRDRYGAFISAMGLAAASLERIALQVRLLQQTEIGEAAEPFGRGQKGSSAMPHKRNPVLCERICGLARVIKKNVATALDNVALWHERDISHSSAERLILPESTILLDYIVDLATRIIDNLVVSPERMKENIQFTHGLIFSQRVLLALCGKGVERKDAYEMVQRNAFASSASGKPFIDLLLADADIRKHLSEQEIRDCFDLSWYLRNIKKIIDRIK